MSPEEKLKELGLVLPEPSTPGGNYKSVNVRGGIAWVAIQFPIQNGAYHYQGILGDEVNTGDGYKAMQLCALNVLAQIYQKVGWENIEGLNHIEAYYRSKVTWDDAPKVVDGASDLFTRVLGEKGTHSRSIIGVSELPRKFCVGLSCHFSLNSL